MTDLRLPLSYSIFLILNSLFPLVFLHDLRLRRDRKIMIEIMSIVTIQSERMTPPTAPPTTAPSGNVASSLLSAESALDVTVIISVGGAIGRMVGRASVAVVRKA